jgi:hypothetical protein
VVATGVDKGRLTGKYARENAIIQRVGGVAVQQPGVGAEYFAQRMIGLCRQLAAVTVCEMIL